MFCLHNILPLLWLCFFKFFIQFIDWSNGPTGALMITYFSNVYLILWILFICMRDKTTNKETSKKNQIVTKTSKKYGHPFWRPRCWQNAVMSWLVWTHLKTWIPKKNLLCPSIECPIWILSTMLVSSHGYQTLYFCCEQEKCQGIDSVPSVKTIATMSPWHLIQRIWVLSHQTYFKVTISRF